LIHINGLFVLNAVVAGLLFLYDEGMSGGGNVEPLVKPTLVDELNCSSVGAFIVLANGFGARGALEPNGFVPKEICKFERRRIGRFFTFCFSNKFIEIN
jgi:hypothetical protein